MVVTCAGCGGDPGFRAKVIKALTPQDATNRPWTKDELPLIEYIKGGCFGQTKGPRGRETIERDDAYALFSDVSELPTEEVKPTKIRPAVSYMGDLGL